MQSHSSIVGEVYSVSLTEERKLKETTKMKRLLFPSVLVLALIATVLLAAGPVTAQATKSEFQVFKVRETWYWDDPNVPVKDWVDADNIYHSQGGASHYRIDAFPGEEDFADPRVFGDEIITGDLTMKLVEDECVWATGPMSGTFLIINGGGSWIGTWTGVRDAQGHSFAYMVGSGSRGYAGLKIYVHMARETCDWTQPETYTGYILDPGK
jgi:hypothetical protein